MSSKPTILWVHGSWHTPNHFKPALEVFDKAGYESVCPRQPSVGNLPPVGLKEDAQCIREELSRLVEQEGKDVLVVAHSYGGMVSNEGIDASMAKAARAKAGKKGGVVRIVFLTAFLVPKGAALSTPLGGAIPPFIPVDVRTSLPATSTDLH
jgi:alpha-beta hydrolase superfamily lysophospholipase